jgi:hypothetical protein
MLRVLVLFVLVYAVTTLAVARLGPLPVEPLLQVAVLLVPTITSLTVVASWYEAGAPWPRFSLRLPGRGRRISLAWNSH